MAKPICLCSIRILHNVDINLIRETITKELNDYHVFVLPALEKQEKIMELEVFYERDFTTKQSEYLHHRVKEVLSRLEKEKKNA